MPVCNITMQHTEIALLNVRDFTVLYLHTIYIYIYLCVYTYIASLNNRELLGEAASFGRKREGGRRGGRERGGRGMVGGGERIDFLSEAEYYTLSLSLSLSVVSSPSLSCCPLSLSHRPLAPSLSLSLLLPSLSFINIDNSLTMFFEASRLCRQKCRAQNTF